jgi:hypothetical protein
MSLYLSPMSEANKPRRFKSRRTQHNGKRGYCGHKVTLLERLCLLVPDIFYMDTSEKLEGDLYRQKDFAS